jgi:hypothetical protein
MAHLSLVRPASDLWEEQRHSEEISLRGTEAAFVRGSLAEACGGAASGKTAAATALLADLTAEGEICAVVDSCGGFDPVTAAASGVVLENLLWVKCGGDLEKAFIAADLLVQAKGFGMVWLDLSGLSRSKLQMVPKTYWYRYRTRIKETPTLFFVTAAEPLAGSASQRSFVFERKAAVWSGSGRFKLLRRIEIDIRSRKDLYAEPMTAKAEAEYDDV